MNEEDYWKHLEFRVCREFSEMPDDRLRFLWCDGLIPDDYILNGRSPSITGWAWICNDRQQDQWQFRLFLNKGVSSLAGIDWLSLLPPENVTRWLAINFRAQQIQIVPLAAQRLQSIQIAARDMACAVSRYLLLVFLHAAFLCCSDPSENFGQILIFLPGKCCKVQIRLKARTPYSR
jgi:hypothetical protein